MKILCVCKVLSAIRNGITQLPFLDDYFRPVLYSHAPEYERNNTLVTFL